MITDLWSYCVFVLLGGVCYYLSGWFRAVCFVLQLPGPPAVPLLGNALLISNQQRLQELGKTAHKEYGLVLRAWLTVVPSVALLTPEHLQIVLSSHKHTEKIFLYKLLHNFIGKGLITSSGKKWRSHRLAIQPSFHLSKLEGFIRTFHDGALLLVEKLSTISDLTSVNITSHVNECVLNILHEAVLGISMSSKSTETLNSPFRQGKVVVSYRLLHPWFLLDWFYRLTDIAKGELQQQKNIVQFTRKVIEERRKAKETQDITPQNIGTSRRISFLDFMIDMSERNNSFSEDDAVEELCTFMLAGQDSVGSALAFCLFELARNPQVQELAVREVDEVFGADERLPSMVDLRQLKYLEQCIKETLRLYPSVPLMSRSLTEDTQIGKYTIPAGCAVLISPFATHRLPSIYPNPEEFDPDRFLPERAETRHPYAFIPFSAGPRNCIGYRFAFMELKTVISTMLRRYHLSTVPGRDKLNLSYRITLRASGGIWLCLIPRSPSNEAGLFTPPS